MNGSLATGVGAGVAAAAAAILLVAAGSSPASAPAALHGVLRVPQGEPAVSVMGRRLEGWVGARTLGEPGPPAVSCSLDKPSAAGPLTWGCLAAFGAGGPQYAIHVAVAASGVARVDAVRLGG